MKRVGIYSLIFLMLQCPAVKAQDIDSTLDYLQQIPTKYISSINNKVDQYSHRITSKTTKTLTKLSRWENKIKALLEKASPQTAAQLFAPGQPTFTSLLEQVKQGEALALSYQAQYNKYTDDINTSLKYIAQQKEQLDSGFIKKAKAAHQKMKALANEEDKAEALQQFIKERKKQLISQAVAHIGQSKYLVKINKEAYYYAETLKNYKEIFSDNKKVEETVKSILNKIPAFQEFMGQNSSLAGIFSSPFSFASLSSSGNIPIVSGLPNRVAIQNFIAVNIPATTTNPIQQIQKPDIKGSLTKWQEKINQVGGIADKDMPDFKPNSMHTKPFKKRLEFSTEFQFTQSDNTHPAISNIGLKVGYKLNDKSTAGIGINYALGLGEGWDKIHISNEGIGLRTFLKWKLKKGFDLQGGSEWNHLKFTNANQLKLSKEWQQAALLGLVKNYNINKKTKGSIQLLYDFLALRHTPVSQPFLFRFGYGFN